MDKEAEAERKERGSGGRKRRCTGKALVCELLHEGDRIFTFLTGVFDERSS